MMQNKTGMLTFFKRFLDALFGMNGYAAEGIPDSSSLAEPDLSAVQISPDDPLIAYFNEHPQVLAIEQMEVDSPAVEAMKQAGVRLVAPLICQGELVGLVNLGARMSTADYSADDYLLLENLISQAAPALRVAQLAELHKAEALKDQRREHEMRMARLIQHTLLPKDLPQMSGWEVAAFYRPAREVGGDFYDFMAYPDGRVAFVIGDVTDKGMPAALLMATTRATLRAAIQRFLSPGEVLEYTNNMLAPDIPPSMFITCLVALLDPSSGRLVYANAGQNLPYRYTAHSLGELHATGMPLGLLPDMTYEEYETELENGESLILYSDGIVEAHNAEREMFGNQRLEEIILRSAAGDGNTIATILSGLEAFTGSDWEQEDDVTMVTIECKSTRRPG